jgi:hypothetical protein
MLIRSHHIETRVLGGVRSFGPIERQLPVPQNHGYTTAVTVDCQPRDMPNMEGVLKLTNRASIGIVC